MGSGAMWGLAIATFVAAAVEAVEALTVVLAVGVTRSWRSALVGTGAALVALVGFTAVTGYALVTWMPRSALQLTIGALLLIFGLQWLRKAILRSAGRKALHDEGEAFDKQTEAARNASGQRRAGLDWFSFVISFKAVFLEGVEVVFIVITFGLNAQDMPVAIAAAAAAIVVMVVAGALARAPLTRIPENTLKYGVGLMLASFGTFWAVEGLGALRTGGQSLNWPGGDVAILALLACWFLLSRVLIARTRQPAPPSAATAPSHRYRGVVG
jgi:uncharacterized membrane protein